MRWVKADHKKNRDHAKKINILSMVETGSMRQKYKSAVVVLISMVLILSSSLFIFSLFPAKLHASITLCDTSINQTNHISCYENSQEQFSPSDSTETDFESDIPANSQTDKSKTPLILPDMSPTNQDLDSSSSLADSSNNDEVSGRGNHENSNDDTNSAKEDHDLEDDKGRESGNHEDESTDREPFLIPFP